MTSKLSWNNIDTTSFCKNPSRLRHLSELCIFYAKSIVHISENRRTQHKLDLRETQEHDILD